MLISELPQPYKALAEKRREEESNANFYSRNSNSIIKAFNWSDTAEGNEFWHDCHYANSKHELPKFPHQEFNELTFNKLTTNKMDDKELIKHLQFQLEVQKEIVRCKDAGYQDDLDGIESVMDIYKKIFFPNEK